MAQGEKSLFWHSKGFRLAQRAQSLIFPAGNFERVSLFGSVIWAALLQSCLCWHQGCAKREGEEVAAPWFSWSNYGFWGKGVIAALAPGCALQGFFLEGSCCWLWLRAKQLMSLLYTVQKGASVPTSHDPVAHILTDTTTWLLDYLQITAPWPSAVWNSSAQSQHLSSLAMQTVHAEFLTRSAWLSRHCFFCCALSCPFPTYTPQNSSIRDASGVILVPCSSSLLQKVRWAWSDSHTGCKPGL